MTSSGSAETVAAAFVSNETSSTSARHSSAYSNQTGYSSGSDTRESASTGSGSAAYEIVWR